MCLTQSVLNTDMLNVWLDRETSLKVPDTITLKDGRTFSTQALFEQCHRVTPISTREGELEPILNRFALLNASDHDNKKLVEIARPRSEPNIVLRAYRGLRRFRYSLIVKPSFYPGANKKWDLSWIPCEFVAYQYAGAWVIRLINRADQTWCLENDTQGMFLAASLPNPHKHKTVDKGLRINNLPEWAENVVD